MSNGIGINLWGESGLIEVLAHSILCWMFALVVWVVGLLAVVVHSLATL